VDKKMTITTRNASSALSDAMVFCILGHLKQSLIQNIPETLGRKDLGSNKTNIIYRRGKSHNRLLFEDLYTTILEGVTCPSGAFTEYFKHTGR